MITKVGNQIKEAGIPGGGDWMSSLSKPTGNSFSNMAFVDKTKSISDMAGAGSKGLILALGAGLVINSLIKRIKNDTRRSALIEDLMLTDPIISRAPKDQVMSFYATINNIAPTVAIDKNATKSLLQHFISFGGIDLPMIKMLAETHSAIDKNQSVDYTKFVGK